MSWIPPSFGIASFRGGSFTPHHSHHRKMTHKFPYVCKFRPLPSEVRQFLSQRTILILSSFSAVRHIRRHTLFMASAFVLPNLPVLHTLRPVRLNACRSVDGMVSGNMDPSFPSSVVQLKFKQINFLPFTQKCAYSRTCRAPPLQKDLNSRYVS